MAEMSRKELTKLQTNIGRTKSMLDSGLHIAEIAATLKLPESTIRSYVDIINGDNGKVAVTE